MPPPPHLRAVLLGASNLHHLLPSVVGALAQGAGGPVTAWAAAGHGRSYGAVSRFAFVRRLPGVVESPLWQEIERHPPAPSVALLTDVGNDLLYGAPVESILGWVETCLDRLAALRARTVLTLLPLARIERLSEVQFQLFRSLFFPFRRASWEGTRQRARALDAGLRALAAERGVATLTLPLDWYGLDPIHLRRQAFPAFCRSLLDLWGVAEGGVSSAPLQRGYRGARLSRETRILGWPLRWPQPALRFRNGSTLHLY